MSLDTGKIKMKPSVTSLSEAEIADDTFITINTNVPINLNASSAIRFRHPINMLNNSINNCNLIHSSTTHDLDFDASANINLVVGTTTYMTVANENITMAYVPTIPSANVPDASNNLNFLNWNNFTDIKSFLPIFRTGAGGALPDADYDYRGGRYMRIGNMIFFNLYFKTLVKLPGTSTNGLQVDLPIAQTSVVNAGNQAFQIGTYSGTAGTAVFSLQAYTPAAIATYMTIQKKASQTATSFTNMTIGDTATNFAITIGGMHYLF